MTFYIGQKSAGEIFLGKKKIGRLYLGQTLVHTTKVVSKPTFLEYVESAGGAYIDTGILPAYDMTVKAKYKYTQLNNTFNPIFGMRTAAVGTGNNLFWAGMHYTDKQAYLRFGGNSINYAMGDSALDVIELTANPDGVFINGVDTGARYYDGAMTQNARLMYLFTINNQYGADGGLGETNARVYSFEVYDGNGVLIQDLRPALDPNGKVGMYDTVTKQYFYNAGTGELKAGGRFVESIVFDGNSFIDTGIAHQTCTIETIIKFEETGTRQLMGFGSGTGQYWGKAANQTTFEYFSGTNALDKTDVRLEYNCDDPAAPVLTMYADGKSRTGSVGTKVSSMPYTIGGLKSYAAATSTNYQFTGEVWGQKTYIGGELVQDLRPYVDSNGVACIKDVVTDTLFYNQGTGTLTYTE